MNNRDAAERVLLDAGEPLHYKKIQLAIDGALLAPAGKTPWETLNAQLCVDIKEHGEQGRFYRHSPGVFGLRKWGLAPAEAPLMKARSVFLSSWDAVRAVLPVFDGTPQSTVSASTGGGPSVPKLPRLSASKFHWPPQGWSPSSPSMSTRWRCRISR